MVSIDPPRNETTRHARYDAALTRQPTEVS
ncbi:hypothetical protein BH11MYX1_BH11MYX1_42810 [soil metagenome]